MIKPKEVILTEIPDEGPEPIFDFTSPEDVLIKVVFHELYPDGWEIEEHNVIRMANPEVVGAASYEMQYGGFLDDRIHEMIDRPSKEGWYVVEGVTGIYTKGDWGFTEDEMDLDFVKVRPATDEDIALL